MQSVFFSNVAQLLSRGGKTPTEQEHCVCTAIASIYPELDRENFLKVCYCLWHACLA
jgi:hypothetical protein